MINSRKLNIWTLLVVSATYLAVFQSRFAASGIELDRVKEIEITQVDRSGSADPTGSSARSWWPNLKGQYVCLLAKTVQKCIKDFTWNDERSFRRRRCCPTMKMNCEREILCLFNKFCKSPQCSSNSTTTTTTTTSKPKTTVTKTASTTTKKPDSTTTTKNSKATTTTKPTTTAQPSSTSTTGKPKTTTKKP